MSLAQLPLVEPCLILGVNINWDNKSFTNMFNNQVIFSVKDYTEQFYQNEEYFYGVYNSRPYVIQKQYFKPQLTEPIVKAILKDPSIVNILMRNEEWFTEQYNKIDWSSKILTF